MNETLNRWIKKFKHWINPRDPYQNEFVEDDLYRGRRSAKRRHRRLVMRRWSILIGSIILVCAVLFGGGWGISKTLYASKVDRATDPDRPLVRRFPTFGSKKERHQATNYYA